MKQKKLEVKEPQNIIICDGIIFDKKRNAYLKANSIIYSGMTGVRLGHLKSILKLPCSKSKFLQAVNKEALTNNGQLIYELTEKNEINQKGISFESNGVEFAPLQLWVRSQIKLTTWQRLRMSLLKLKRSLKAKALTIFKKDYQSQKLWPKNFNGKLTKLEM